MEEEGENVDGEFGDEQYFAPDDFGVSSEDSSDFEFEDYSHYLVVNNSGAINKLKSTKEQVALISEALSNSHGLLKTKQDENERLTRQLEAIKRQLEEIKLQRVGVGEEVAATQHAAKDARGGSLIEGGRDPLTILPEEVWEVILAELGDFVDLCNSSLTCKLFSNILKPRRTQWLFPKIFPLIYFHLEHKDVLDCRLVCKKWMTAVDTHIDDKDTVSVRVDPSHYNSIQYFFKYDERGFPHPFSLYKFRSSDQLDEPEFYSYTATPEMGLHSRNPFLGRALSILDFEATPVFVQDTIQFLDKCGQHIWHLKIRPTDRGLLPLGCLQLLNECLAKTPNLKTLLLNFFDLQQPAPSNLVSHKLICPPSLGTLLVQFLPDESGPEQEEIYGTTLVSGLSQQLTRFQIPIWVRNFLGLQWPNLKMLHLGYLHSEESLLNLLSTRLPNLQKLAIHFASAYEYKPSELLEQVLQISNHFESLTSLELDGLDHFILKMEDLASLPAGLYAPARLTSLQVDGIGPYKPLLYTFLLRFPFLKYLNVWAHPSIKRVSTLKKYWNWDPTGISKGLFYKDLYGAPVWKLLPYLQVLACKWNYMGGPGHYSIAYTRQGYTVHPPQIYLGDAVVNDNDDSDSDVNVE